MRKPRARSPICAAAVVALATFLADAALAEDKKKQDTAGVFTVSVTVKGLPKDLLKFTRVKVVSGTGEFRPTQVRLLQPLVFRPEPGQENAIGGVFSVEGVPGGPARVEVIPARGKIPEPQTVEVRPGTDRRFNPREVAVGFTIEMSGINLRGRLTNHGQPVEGLDVWLAPVETSRFPVGLIAHAAPDGTYELPNIDPGKYKLQVMKKETATLPGSETPAVVHKPLGETTLAVTESMTFDIELSELSAPNEPPAATPKTIG